MTRLLGMNLSVIERLLQVLDKQILRKVKFNQRNTDSFGNRIRFWCIRNGLGKH